MSARCPVLQTHLNMSTARSQRCGFSVACGCASALVCRGEMWWLWVDTSAIRCMALCLNPQRCQRSYSARHLRAAFMHCFPTAATCSTYRSHTLLILNVLCPCHSLGFPIRRERRYGDEQETLHYTAVFYSIICCLTSRATTRLCFGCCGVVRCCFRWGNRELTSQIAAHCRVFFFCSVHFLLHILFENGHGIDFG